MAEFKPSTFSAALVLLIPTYTTTMGVPTKAFPSPGNPQTNNPTNNTNPPTHTHPFHPFAHTSVMNG